MRRSPECGRAAPRRRTSDRGWVEAGDHATEALQAAGYEIEQELGRGGMGVVYRAYQAQARPHRGAEGDQVGRVRHRGRMSPVPERGRGGRAARPSPHRPDFRGRREPGLALLQHEADRGHQPRQAARRLQPRRPRRGPAGRDRRGGDAPRPSARDPPSRPEAGQHPDRRARPTPRDRLRAGPAHRGRRRPDAIGRHRGDSVLHVAGAGDGREGEPDDGHRRLRTGRSPVRLVDRPGPPRRQYLRRGPRPGPRECARASVEAQPQGPARPGGRLPEVP